MKYMYLVLAGLVSMMPIFGNAVTLSENVSITTSTDESRMGSYPKNLDDILASFPTNEVSIERFKTSAIEEVETSQYALLNLPQEKRNFEQAILGWSKMLEKIFFQRLKLVFLPFMTSDQSAIAKGISAADELDRTILELLKNKEFLEFILSYIEQTLNSPSNDSLSPYQLYQMSQITHSIAEVFPDNQKASSLYKRLSSQTTENFIYKKGLAPQKTLPENKVVSVINWNVCFFDENLSTLMGGVLPWKYRLTRIADAIKKRDADIVCLQELFSRDGAYLLYKALKKNYAYFYINIGPKVFGFDEQSFGIPSGLFFASKYPINNPVFQPYNFQETPKNRAYGFFSAEIMDHETPIAKIITTHLQPNSTEEDLQYRHGQIQAIVKKSHNMIPTFVCGDLNIEKDSVEYKKELKPYFIDYYHDSNWTCCELRDFWWKANQNINQFQKFESPLETIDYFLQMKSSRFSPLEVETRIFPVNFLDNPQDSLSDHQMMISQIKFR